MTMSILDRVPAPESITAEARQVQFRATLVLLLSALCFALGWLASKPFRAGWFAGAWMFVAMRRGFRAGMPPRPSGPSEPF